MFGKLQKKWKVGGWQLALIISTFAIGGSLTGFLGKKIMNGLNIREDWLWAIVYILLVVLIWPLAVLLLSIPFGQFSFFRVYIRKIGARMGIARQPGSTIGHPPTLLAVFASGAGSNAKRIIDHFREHPGIRVAMVVCNKPGAGVLDIAAKENIPVLLVEKERFFHGDAYATELEKKKIGFIALAGFLWKIPAPLLNKYPGRIVNIHPALLPKYGGKGMHGQRVHEAVLAEKEKESGISIHYVDELFDHGKIIFQATCPVFEKDTPSSLAERIHGLEHEFYPSVIEEVIEETHKSN